MVKNMKYRVVKPLPDGLGAIIVGGASFVAGEEVTSDSPQDILEDYLQRELIEIFSASTEKEENISAPKGRFRPISKWKFDPSKLVGKTLVQLNVMICERDPEIEPFDSLQAAIEYLTKDFEGKS